MKKYAVDIQLRLTVKAFAVIEGEITCKVDELIKKTIQPHFIANSLSAIRALSKTNPNKAERLVQAIANEFYLLNSR